MAIKYIFVNFFDTELLAGVSPSATTLTVTPTASALIPVLGVDERVQLTLWDGQQEPEIVALTTNPQTGTLTVLRGQEGTTAKAWGAGTQVAAGLTAEVINAALEAFFDFNIVLAASFLPLAGGTLTGPLTLSGAPTLAGHAVNKTYADSIGSDKLARAGGTMTGDINMDSNRVLGLAPPVADQEAATKKYVDDEIGGLSSSVDADVDAINETITGLGVVTGDVKFSIRTGAMPGWVRFNDGTIGNASSAATTRANDDCEALFKLIWDTFDNALAPVSPGVRGASAQADWNANKQIKLLTKLGRALGFAGNGVGLTNRTAGSIIGDETKIITLAHLPSENLSSANLTAATTLSGPATSILRYAGGFSDVAETIGGARVGFNTSPSAITLAATTTVGGNVPLGGSDDPFDVMNPTFYLNAYIKL